MKAYVVILLLQRAYAAELETVRNYLAYLVWLDHVRAQEVFDVVASHISDELTHAKRLARRLEQLGARPQLPPALPRREAQQKTSDPSGLQGVVTDALHSKLDAIAAYQEIIAACQDTDPLTANLATSILADEEAHHLVFAGLLQNANQTVMA
jgi:bacterioferritin